jgi:hypothetical protein
MTASAMAPIGYGKGAEPNSIKQEPGSNGRGEATAVPAPPAQDPGKLAVDPHQGKARLAGDGCLSHLAPDRVPILGHAGRLQAAPIDRKGHADPISLPFGP